AVAQRLGGSRGSGYPLRPATRATFPGGGVGGSGYSIRIPNSLLVYSEPVSRAGSGHRPHGIVCTVRGDISSVQSQKNSQVWSENTPKNRRYCPTVNVSSLKLTRSATRRPTAIASPTKKRMAQSR